MIELDIGVRKVNVVVTYDIYMELEGRGMKTIITLLFASLIYFCATASHADTFGGGPYAFEIEFVTVGNPGNPADTTGVPNPAGNVDYTYRIGKFEISEDMVDKAKANFLGNLGIGHNERGPNKPASSISWFEAARFVNWLNTSTGSPPAYKFVGFDDFQSWEVGEVGYDPTNPYRNSQSTYFLPSLDEWYKAAYYDPIVGVYYDFPTGSDAAPVAVASGAAAATAVFDQSFSQGPADITLAGGLSPSGTVGQGGNVWEWEETEFDLSNDASSELRGVRGGGWINDASNLSSSLRFFRRTDAVDLSVGFRVASKVIPEPTACGLAIIATLCMVVGRHRRNSSFWTHCGRTRPAEGSRAI